MKAYRIIDDNDNWGMLSAYNYTIYAPTYEAMQKAQKEMGLPTWKSVMAIINNWENVKDQYGFEIKYYDGSLTMYYGVETREVAACFEDTQIMRIQIQDLELSMEVVDGSENEGSPYGFVVFSEDKQDLLDQFSCWRHNLPPDRGLFCKPQRG